MTSAKQGITIFPSLRAVITEWAFLLFVTVACLSVFSACTETTPTVQNSITLAEDTRPFLDLRGVWSVRRDTNFITSSTNTLKGNLQERTVEIPSNWYNQGIDTAGTLVFVRHFGLAAKPSEDLFSLVFEGVDYEAEVVLNGTYLGKHIGYFQPFVFHIADCLRWNGDNILQVRVSSPKERPEDWSLRKRLIKGIFGHHDTRPGGAWSVRGQDANTGGIWGRVYIAAANSAEIRRVGITPLINEAEAASFLREVTSGQKPTQPVRVALQTHIWANSPKQVTMRYTARCTSDASSDSYQQQHNLHIGSNIVFDTITISKPLLWYTYDVGTPHLYTLETELLLTTPSVQKALPLRAAARSDKFGIRTIRYDKPSGAWYLNGKRLFLRGTNYIGTQFLSTMTRTDYDRDAVMMRSANINAVRVHAHIARKEWYDACDSLGIVIWQDFPLQWGYSDDADVIQSASNQVKDMIAVLGNHPSVGAWCLHNEPPFDADWMQYKYPHYQPLQNRSMNHILTRIARHLDSTRYVHPFSATSEHRWEGWYFGSWTDYAKPTKEPLVTEFGAQALPGLETMRTIPGISATLPTTDSAWSAWEYHNFQKHETFHFAKVPTGSNIEEFVRHSQEHQAQVTSLAAESYRLQRFAPVGAIFQFMFVEAWASMNWAVVDYRRTPKEAYAALKETYQPIFIATRFDTLQGKLHIALINDTWQSYRQSRLSYTLESPNLLSITKTLPVTLESDTIQPITELHLVSQGNYTFQAVLLSHSGDTLSVRKKVLYYRVQ